ncbi:class I SAM-dependent methyltransferase [Thermococcus radiotolerans]|uniref:SAM-dependent methyltransferase n=1 Tax=Thermococcus radiotolerans TaxID=187880 RepID=A0A2Z2MV20_9EURY|nr:methyltransferase domain-containing protein [Thermococcus radiotolerans]ASJ13785.1 SAM-dependent methyltransferase [Thermococcus radiotolerans]
MNPLAEILDRNLEAIVDLSLGHLLRLGLKYGIFRRLASGMPREELLSVIPVSNKAYLGRLIDTYVSLGFVEESDGILKMPGFSYEFNLSAEDAGKLLSDWVQIVEELYKMADYAFISAEHPKILMDFDKGADFWDMRLLMELNRTYRQLAASLLGLEDGMRILDLGCGSVSPVELGEAVGPNGKYVGVDFSPGLLSIAKVRVRNARMDWVVLREMDIRKLVVKNTYDAVVMSFVLEYLENPGAAVKRAIGTLEPGGKLVIIEPFRDNYPRIAALEFFESLTREFTRFPSSEDIIAAVEESPYDVKVEPVGKSALLVTRLM